MGNATAKQMKMTAVIKREGGEGERGEEEEEVDGGDDKRGWRWAMARREAEDEVDRCGLEEV
jgi:hypothetical protein